MSPRWKTVLSQQHGRITGTLRDAVLGRDAATCRNGCQAAVWFREYDLIPTLLTVLQDANSPHADLAAETLLELLEHLYDELAGTRDRSDRRDPQMIRRFVVGALEPAVQRFGQHKRREVIEAFLLLVGRDNVTLKQILQSPHHPALAAMVETLTRSGRKGVVRLLLSLLDDPHMPTGALAVIGGRDDLPFIQYLLRKIGREPAPAVAQNLKRIDSLAWLRDGARSEESKRLWESLDDAGQHALVRLVMASGIPRLQAFTVIEEMLLRGKPGGRREAARALAEFHGAEANALAMTAVKDHDPQVQAQIVAQLRGRGIPGVLPGLVEMVDSPHAVVRKAARESLAEFSFRRFLGAFDMLDDQVRQSTGMLVKKIDPQTVPQLKEEMGSPMRTRRLRALLIARLIDVVAPLEEPILGLLEDDDHMVRMEAAAALGALPARSAGKHWSAPPATAAKSFARPPCGAWKSGLAARQPRTSKGKAMHSLWDHCLLFAERSRLDNISEPFKGRPTPVDKGDIVAGLLILAGIAALVWLLSRFLGAQDRRQTYNSPRRLFFSLCRMQGLRWSDRWLLWRLARARRLKDPARLFLEPQWFEATGLGRSLRLRATRLKQLRQGLFAGLRKQEEKQPPAGEKATPPRPLPLAKGSSPPPLLPVQPSPVLDISPWPVAGTGAGTVAESM